MENVLNAVDNNKSTEPVESTPTPTAQKPLTRKSVSLTAGVGPTKTRMIILAKRTRSGGETSVETTDAKKKTSRGMRTKHDTFELAVAALAKLVAEAVQKGWKKSERAGGFRARPDAFSTIPTAPKR